MHLGDLARIALTDEEIARLQGELNVIADAINKVQEVAGDDVPPTANPVPLEAYLRPDVAETPLTQEEPSPALRCPRAACSWRRAFWGRSEMTDELVKLSAAQMAAKIKSGEVSSRELVEAHLKVIEAAEPSIQAFLQVSADEARAQADAFDEKTAKGQTEGLPELAGVPIAIKDMIVTKGIVTTAASKILEGWVPPYDATVIEKLKAAGMPLLGQDEPGRVRAGLLHRAFRVRPDSQPVGHRPCAGWLRRRLGLRGGRLRGPAGPGHRHRRLDSSAGCADRYGRRQADLRRREPFRCESRWRARWTRSAR